jgi:Predicted nucleotidyltransferase
MGSEKPLEHYGRLIYSSIAGSHSYGTNIEGSDMDIRGVFVPHREFLVGLKNIDEWTHPEDEDTKYFSLFKFLTLALEGNPNVVEQLFVDPKHIIFMNEYGKELYDLRKEFLTKNAYGRFGGYAYSQMKRLNSKNNGSHHGSHKSLIEKYGYDTKHAMHLKRLYHMGIMILETHNLQTMLPPEIVEDLIFTRNGGYTLEEIKLQNEELNEKLEKAMKNSTIPNYPDFDKINKWAVSVVDRIHGINTTKGVFKGSQFNVLPLEYEMVDKCAVLVVANRLSRKKSKDNARGIIIPYKDWFIGLREFKKPFKFDNTSIESLHRIAGRVKSGDPTIIDMIFAGESNIIFKHPMAKEMIENLKKLINSKSIYNKAINYVFGNLKSMEYWEQQKRIWIKLKEENPNKYNTEYPPVPKNTTADESSIMFKYGYNTILAYDLVHVLKMYIELLETGTIEDSRKYEPELYSIKHGYFKTFDEFKIYIESLLDDLNKAYEKTILRKEANFNEFEKWLIDFVERFHSQLD